MVYDWCMLLYAINLRIYTIGTIIA